MRQLREDERDEIEAVGHFIKYVLSKRDAEGFEVWEAVMKLDAVGKKFVLTETVTEEELSELMELDDMKELMLKLFSKIRTYVKTGEVT